MSLQGFIICINLNHQDVGMRTYYTVYGRLQRIFKHQILIKISDSFRVQALHNLRIIKQAGQHGLILYQKVIQHGIGLPDLFLNALLFLIQQIGLSLMIGIDPQRNQRYA